MPTRRRRVDSPGSITNFKRAVTGVASKEKLNSHGKMLVPTHRNHNQIIPGPTISLIHHVTGESTLSS
jgi:hypothetical protein